MKITVKIIAKSAAAGMRDASRSAFISERARRSSFWDRV